MARRFTIVSYDISDDKRRDKVAKVLLAFGDRVQYSVFCCALSPRERIQLRDKLRMQIHHREDQILFLDAGPVSGLNPEPEISTLGKDYQPAQRSQIV